MDNAREHNWAVTETLAHEIVRENSNDRDFFAKIQKNLIPRSKCEKLPKHHSKIVGNSLEVRD